MHRLMRVKKTPFNSKRKRKYCIKPLRTLFSRGQDGIGKGVGKRERIAKSNENFIVVKEYLSESNNISAKSLTAECKQPTNYLSESYLWVKPELSTTEPVIKVTCSRNMDFDSLVKAITDERKSRHCAPRRILGVLLPNLDGNDYTMADPMDLVPETKAGYDGSSKVKTYLYRMAPIECEPSADSEAQEEYLASRPITTLPPCLDQVQGFLRVVLSYTGVTESLSTPVEFTQQGVDATNLRNPDHKHLPFLQRDSAISAVMCSVARARSCTNKPPIIAISAGRGQGKSELAARLVENWDRYVFQNNTAENRLCEFGADEYLACAVAFCDNFPVSIDEEGLVLEVLPEMGYELFISLRLVFIWLIDKKRFKSFSSFLYYLKEILSKAKPSSQLRNWIYSFRLRAIVDILKSLSKRRKVVVVVDDSLLPLKIMHSRLQDEDSRSAVLSELAQLQSLDLTLVFTTRNSAPFQYVQTMQSCGEIAFISLSSLSTANSSILIEKTLDLTNMYEKCVSRNGCNHSTRALHVLAWWSGGVPRLCIATAKALAHVTTTDVTKLLSMMDENFVGLYGRSVSCQYDRRQAFVLALLGAKIPPSVKCLMQGGDSVDEFIACNILSRQEDHRLFLPPLFLKLFVQPLLPATNIGASTHSLDEADKILAEELLPLLDVIYPCGIEQSFGTVDRLQFRLLRLAREQFIADIQSNSLVMFVTVPVDSKIEVKKACEIVDGKIVCTEGVEIDKACVDWTRATLKDYFGPFSYSFLGESVGMARFNMSQPYVQKVCAFHPEEMPQYRDCATQVHELTSRQYYPAVRANACFDWFGIYKDEISGQLYVVVTIDSRKFNTVPENLHDLTGLKQEILRMFEETLLMFVTVGCQKEQVIFRLLCPQCASAFEDMDLQQIHPNIIVCSLMNCGSSLDFSTSVGDLDSSI